MNTAILQQMKISSNSKAGAYLTDSFIFLSSSTQLGLCDRQTAIMDRGASVIADNGKTNHFHMSLVSCPCRSAHQHISDLKGTHSESADLRQGQMSYLTMLKKVKKKNLDPALDSEPLQNVFVFHENWPGSFCTILLTDQTNHQMAMQI